MFISWHNPFHESYLINLKLVCGRGMILVTLVDGCQWEMSGSPSPLNPLNCQSFLQHGNHHDIRQQHNKASLYEKCNRNVCCDTQKEYHSSYVDHIVIRFWKMNKKQARYNLQKNEHQCKPTKKKPDQNPCPPPVNRQKNDLTTWISRNKELTGQYQLPQSAWNKY